MKSRIQKFVQYTHTLICLTTIFFKNDTTSMDGLEKKQAPPTQFYILSDLFIIWNTIRVFVIMYNTNDNNNKILYSVYYIIIIFFVGTRLDFKHKKTNIVLYIIL